MRARPTRRQLAQLTATLVFAGSVVGLTAGSASAADPTGNVTQVVGNCTTWQYNLSIISGTLSNADPAGTYQVKVERQGYNAFVVAPLSAEDGAFTVDGTSKNGFDPTDPEAGKTLVWTISNTAGATPQDVSTGSIQVTPCDSVNYHPVIADADTIDVWSGDSMSINYVVFDQYGNSYVSWSIATQPAHGRAADHFNQIWGALLYTANAGYVGPDQFGANMIDGKGHSAVMQIPVNVRAIPVPSAAFTSTVNGPKVSFNATTSRVSSSSITSYKWSFGDGASGAGAKPTHTYAKSGTKLVTLTVTSSLGAKKSVAHHVTVPPKPAVNISAPARVKLGKAFKLSWSTGNSPTKVLVTGPSIRYGGKSGAVMTKSKVLGTLRYTISAWNATGSTTKTISVISVR